MGINSIRQGDTIYGAWGGQYEVIEHDYEKVKTVEVHTKRRKTFKAESLECVDHDDGLWQEMVGD